MTLHSLINKTGIPAMVAALVVFTGCGDKHHAGGHAVVSAEKTSFDAVTGKLDSGGRLFGYLSTEQWVRSLSAKMEGYRELINAIPDLSESDQKNLGQVYNLLTHLAKTSGVEEISGIGISSVARQTNLYCNKFIIHHYPGKNTGLLWSMFGATPHSLDGLDLLPETTALAFFGDANLPLIWSTVQAEVAQLGNAELTQKLQLFPSLFETQTKLKWDDVLASLGGEYGFILTLDTNSPVSIPTGQNMIQVPTPGLALVVKVKNDLVFDAVSKSIESDQVIKVDTANLKMRTQPVPLPLPIQLRPTIARSGEYLILASTDALVKEMLDVKAAKKKGWKSTEDFKRLAQGIPLKGNSFVYTGRVLSETMIGIQKTASAAGMNSGKRELINKLFSGSRPADAFSVGANTAEGWENIGNASK